MADAQIKLSAVVSDLFGVSSRAMLAAFFDWERDPRVLSELARGSMRREISVLTEALIGRVTDHQVFLLQRMLRHVDGLSADIAELEDRIEAEIAPLADAVTRLDEIPGVGVTAAQIIIAEIGLDMSRFPTPGHLASWVKLAPGVKESASRSKGNGNGSTGHGDPYLARVLGEAAIGASRTNTFLGERYRRIARRRGKQKTIIAVGRPILVTVWNLLSQDHAHFQDLGADFHDKRRGTEAIKRNHVRQLEALGFTVTLRPTAA